MGGRRRSDCSTRIVVAARCRRMGCCRRPCLVGCEPAARQQAARSFPSALPARDRRMGAHPRHDMLCVQLCWQRQSVLGKVIVSIMVRARAVPVPVGVLVLVALTAAAVAQPSAAFLNNVDVKAMLMLPRIQHDIHFERQSVEGKKC